MDKIFNEIRQKLLSDNLKAKVANNRYIQKLNCPVCNHNEAWAYYDKPLAIICQRGNHCYSNTPIKDIYPEVFKSFAELYPATQYDKKATARAYLESRYLDSLEYTQGYVKEDNKFYQTVKIEIDPELTFHRLIDYDGKDKNRLYGSYKNKVWQTKNINFANQVFIVEGIFDAQSLNQKGMQAIAVFSSSHLPEAFYLKHKETEFIIAFDNDTAGHRAIDKHIDFFKKQNIKHRVFLSLVGRDFNDCLISNMLNDKYIGDCFKRGELYVANSPDEYFEIYSNWKNIRSLIFSFRHQTYKGYYTKAKKGEESEARATRIADCEFKLMHSIIDESIKEKKNTKHRIECYSEREGRNVIKFSAEEITQLSCFKLRLNGERQVFYGDGNDLTALYDKLLNDLPTAPKIRGLNTVGYDEDSDCYVFPHFLYDKNGVRYSMNGQGYFEKQKLLPYQDKTIACTKKLLNMDIDNFLDVLHGAYGYRGLTTHGFWVASAFSHLIFKEYGFFPFISLYGDSKCGKSYLTKLLNRCFFLDWEGISMTKANTQKYELRKISQKSSLVVPMVEGRADNSKFDYDSVLPLYNRNPMAGRALTTQDNQTHELPFNATLAFVQNREQFISTPAKERVVSIQFLNSDISDETYASWQLLNSFGIEQLASVGDFILRNRKYFEEHLINEIEIFKEALKKIEGIKENRIAENHAIIAGALFCFLKCLDNHKYVNINYQKYIARIALKKIETAREVNDLAELFLEGLNTLPPTEENGIIIDNYKKEIKVHMVTVLEKLKITNKQETLKALRIHDRFISSDVTVRTALSRKSYWILKTAD